MLPKSKTKPIHTDLGLVDGNWRDIFSNYVSHLKKYQILIETNFMNEKFKFQLLTENFWLLIIDLLQQEKYYDATIVFIDVFNSYFKIQDTNFKLDKNFFNYIGDKHERSKYVC